MSLDHLRDLAGKLRDHREQQLKKGFVGPNTEAKLLAEAFYRRSKSFRNWNGGCRRWN
jgi:hypothetical protein